MTAQQQGIDLQLYLQRNTALSESPEVGCYLCSEVEWDTRLLMAFESIEAL